MRVAGHSFSAPRALLFLTLGLSLLVIGFVQYRRYGNQAARQTAREALLSRQNQALLALTADADRGTLLNFESVLIVVDQELVQDLLREVTPMEAEIGGGFYVKVDTVEASFGDGVALVNITGTYTATNEPVGARVTVFGSIDAVDIDTASGVLRCNVSILAVEGARPKPLG